MTTSNALPPDVLTQSDAEARAARVSNASYEIAVDIHAGAATYRGEVTIRFGLSSSGDTFMDFRGKTIERLTVNGRDVQPPWNGVRLTLPAEALAAHNTVHVVYENEYDHQGDGFHQFIDPEDGEEYLYTNFEPYESHRLFPNFDQPDIKATYALRVAAPAGWEVIHNSRLEGTEAADDGRSTRTFATTQPFSSYLFALVCGPYAALRDEHEGMPIGLFCRKSLVEKLDTNEVFAVTKQGLAFFAEFFDYPYPFDKYDQVFVPEFNAGAMENVGCVTHNEYMVFREPPTDNQRRNRAEVILHEMAHMWFGDLVTMRWWNDLWLNESFATYMAYLAMAEATRFKNGWLDFNASEKNWGYRQDQLITTHPIAGQVNDTQETFLNFDGITYAKGASVIKQLVASIGMDGFRAGMRHYFKTHAFGNTTLQQFLQSLEIGSGQPLQDWSRLWLETASLNTIGAEWESDGERLTSLALWQTAPADHPTIRPHVLEVGLLGERDGSGLQVTVLPARIEGARAELSAAPGLARPLLVFPNYNDHAWAKIALDGESLAFVRDRLEDVNDDLLRQMLWSSLYTMVRDQLLKSTDYLALVRVKLPLEPNLSLVDAVLNQAGVTLGRFVPDRLRDGEANAMFEMARAALAAAAAGDAQIIWARNVIGFATAPRSVALCAQLADGGETIAGLTIDQDMRWSIAAKFVAYGMPGATERVAAEAQRDPTDRGQRARIQAETSAPEPSVKAAAWEKILSEGYGSLHLTEAAMAGFNWWKQRDILTPYVDHFFEVITGVFRERDNEFARGFHRSLFPGYIVEEDTVRRARRVVEAAGPELPTLVRSMRESIDELERAMRCRSLVEG